MLDIGKLILSLPTPIFTAGFSSMLDIGKLILNFEYKLTA